MHTEPVRPRTQSTLYDEAIASYGAALGRLARSYEADPDTRQDLLQDMHLALWRSFARFDGRSSLRTWVYRVAHIVAASHVLGPRRYNARTLVGLDELERSHAGIDMMPSNPSLDDASAAWQAQAADVLHVSPRELAMRIQAVDRKVRRSFAIVNSILILQVVVFTVVLVAFDDPIQRIGALLIVGAMIYLAWQIRLHTTHMQAARTDVDRSVTPSLSFVRAYLETRREFHSGV